MLVIRCPYCTEERLEDELVCGGEADLKRPADPSRQSDSQWTDYLYVRVNTLGVRREHWCCAAGCGRWFKVARHTVTHEVTEVVRFEEELTGESEAGT